MLGVIALFGTVARSTANGTQPPDRVREDAIGDLNMSGRRSVNQRERLSRFVDLARVYRGWTRSELSTALGRDPSKLIPESGNPKLDLLVGIADALDWTVGDVAESVWKDPKQCGPEYEDLDYVALNKLSLEAHRNGQWQTMSNIANAMMAKSRSATEYAVACNRLGGAYDGLQHDIKKHCNGQAVR